MFFNTLIAGIQSATYIHYYWIFSCGNEAPDGIIKVQSTYDTSYGTQFGTIKLGVIILDTFYQLFGLPITQNSIFPVTLFGSHVKRYQQCFSYYTLKFIFLFHFYLGIIGVNTIWQKRTTFKFIQKKRELIL